MKRNIPFKLFANCIPVKGAHKAIIQDLQRDKVLAVNNDLFELINKHEGYSINEVLKKYDESYHENIIMFFNFLYENDMIFFTEYPERFPDIKRSWDRPSIITNAIIEINIQSYSKIKNCIKELDGMNCKHLQIHFRKEQTLINLKKFLSGFKTSTITSIKIILSYTPELIFDVLNKLADDYPRVCEILIHTARNNAHYVHEHTKCQIIYTKTKNIDFKCCGSINQRLFRNNILFFTEAQHHNTCLNRKISIDAEGNIKNCPSMPESYGNIKDTTLREALEKPDFKKYWNINKDKIHVCKDCEFRYICTDCRAFIEDPEDIYSKPLKCGYNPYTGEWSEWTTNPLKSKAIEYYGLEELIARREDKRTSTS